ncbi:MAG: hypothetical protein JNM88_01495 [Chitinophagaceae bacterium]|nr:hypothetical protein [Chitinophagaceae bacterium]
MKKIIMLLIVAGMFSTARVQAQVIEVDSLEKNSVIDVPAGDINLSANSVSLDNVILKGKNVTIGNSVGSIKVFGNVEISCVNLVINASGAINIDPESTGTLTIEYSGSFTNTNKRAFKLTGGAKLKITILKK